MADGFIPAYVSGYWAPVPGALLSETISFDSREYELVVSSDYGNPVPIVGTSQFAWKATVMCSVDAAVVVGGTNFTCIGWTGTGNVPASGSSHTVTVALSNLISSLTWNWASDDTDLDGMPDDWELEFFGNLNQAAINDFDWDGQDDLSEFIAGTNPTNAASLFKLSESIIPEGYVVAWPMASNRTYNVYWTDNLSFTSFQPLVTNITYPCNSITTIPSSVRGFFKMDVRK